MGALYPGTSVNGYNANPPPDDGTTIATNLVTWAGIKTKIGDPLNTFAAGVDSNLTAAFGKTLDGATIVSTAVDYPMTAADQGRLIVVTVAGKTVTTPDATVVGAPFAFAVSNQSTGTITIDGSGTQTVDGQLTQVIKSGSGCIIRTDGSNWFTFGLKAAQLTSVNPPFGFDVPINLGLVASVGSGLLTVAVKTNSGADPTPGDPVLIPFRDVTVANGDPVWIAITAALSINTNAIGATLGSQNAVPFRLWVVAFNNSGTPVLGLWHSGSGAATNVINALNEETLRSATAISAAATSAGVIYCPNGTTITSKAFKVLGYLSYETTLATAGNYTAAPDILQLFGPGISKPGTPIQVQASAASNTAAITPGSKANLVLVQMSGTITASATAGTYSTTALAKRGTAGGTTIASSTFQGSASGSITVNTPYSLVTLDNPGVSASQTYTITSTAAGTGSGPGQANQQIVLTEVMG